MISLSLTASVMQYCFKTNVLVCYCVNNWICEVFYQYSRGIYLLQLVSVEFQNNNSLLKLTPTGKWFTITFQSKVFAMPFEDQFEEHILSTMCRHMCKPYHYWTLWFSVWYGFTQLTRNDTNSCIVSFVKRSLGFKQDVQFYTQMQLRQDAMSH